MYLVQAWKMLLILLRRREHKTAQLGTGGFEFDSAGYDSKVWAL
jgi:hypothetical protein